MQLRRIPLVFVLLLWSALAGAQAPPPQPDFPGETWQSATPEEAGMDAHALATLLEYGSNVQMDTPFVARHGIRRAA